MSTLKYEYIQNNNLENPLKYNYTSYLGQDFMKAWYLSRTETGLCYEMSNMPDGKKDIFCDNQVPKNPQTNNNENMIYMQEELNVIWEGLIRDQQLSKKQWEFFDKCIKTFEVRKRLYHHYSLQFKPEDETDYKDIDLYLMFACICAEAYRAQKDLRYLNALLKINDTIISQLQYSFLPVQASQRRAVSYALSSELEFIGNICSANKLDWGLQNENS